ncbi:MAG TPA: ribose 5-phosphate isomerase B [Leptospiraceae bacterium]|nr:ribose 5-phosphate isomerase B [Leptospiraceae bacterium]HMW07787.1 ribose 5-phosphate isomerase B [Leptospiraceae bacterium]HMX35595.1 ribose 5-phosphate isomerase B [Leptospiraceae bacterium]HMY34169.1 ribose 5-phosphate isomerase B [Leptospiraceae bacterium]HMZ64070.1 ribose 5-phosphate isomerase B [Leptospiraceae bacterium]
MKEKIGIVSDHGGFELKEFLRKQFDSDLEIIDCGVHSEASVDYPVVIREACSRLKKGEFEKLIALCGTGIGASIAANRIKGIRAALCHDEFTAEMSKRHNNANVIVLGGRVLGKDLSVRIVKKWLESKFEAGRHENRINLLDLE